MNRRTFTKFGVASALATSGTPLALSGLAQSPSLTGELRIDPSGAPISFNPMIFGQFLEHFHRQVYGGIFDPGSPLSDERGFRLDVVEALRELKVPIVRWPGGCFVSTYHWQDGVGRVRKPSFSKAWGVEDPNTFGTDEFVEWCKLIGAEPYLCTNAGTGTNEEMSDWVEYCNLKQQGRFARVRASNGHPEPYKVRYWSIGNENYFSTELGSKTAEEWPPLVRESAKLMRAVDPDLKLLAAATVDGNWTEPMLKYAGKYIDMISIHGYWDFLWEWNTKPADYLHSVAKSGQPEQQIQKAIQLLQKTGTDNRIRIAFDEWNLRSWHHPDFPGGGASKLAAIQDRDENDRNEVYTMADAVFTASFLNGCLRNAKYVQMACMAPVVNVRGPLYVHPKGVVRRTTFHVLKMYSSLLEPEVVPVTLSGGDLSVDGKSFPALDAVVTRSTDGRRVAIALVNRDPERAAQFGLSIGALQPRSAISMTVLDGDSPNAFNDVLHPERVKPRTQQLAASTALQIPPHSLSVASYSL